MTFFIHCRTTLLKAVLVLCVATWAGSAAAEDIPIVTGVHWTQSSVEAKKAYLVGVANFVAIEVAYEGANPPADAQSITARFAKGMRGKTLDGVREGLDRWYAAHPDQANRPVIETIWFEMVQPGLK